jgi:hypothetical protein
MCVLIKEFSECRSIRVPHSYLMRQTAKARSSKCDVNPLLVSCLIDHSNLIDFGFSFSASPTLNFCYGFSGFFLLPLQHQQSNPAPKCAATFVRVAALCLSLSQAAEDGLAIAAGVQRHYLYHLCSISVRDILNYPLLRPATDQISQCFRPLRRMDTAPSDQRRIPRIFADTEGLDTSYHANMTSAPPAAASFLAC